MQHGQRTVRTCGQNCWAGVPSSDALQEYDTARRAELDVLEQERKEREELRKAEVRPDCVVLLCRRAYVLMLCRKHAGRSRSRSARRSARS